MNNKETDVIIEFMQDVGKRIENGEKEGDVSCPFCSGTVHYLYFNSMAMRAKCNSCDFHVFS